jgi:GT2 family glycosyltransferase
MAQDPFPAGVGLASGEFIVLLLPGATMAPDALFHFVELLNREPATDLAYADEDLIARSGERRQPFFKPSWSPDLLLSMNYIGDTFLVRRSLAAEAGAHDPYDLLLRITADTSRVRRVPRVLFHLSAGLGRSPDAERRALHDHLLRVHPGAWTEPDADHRRWRVRYPLPREGRVSIIIPSAGKVDLLEANLADLESKTHYPHYEIVVADNSRGEELQRFVRSSSSGNRTLRYLDYRHTAFNFASICNAAARTCNSPFLVFLNDDTRPIAPGWLGAMVELGARPEVGAVGARLLFPNGTIQHAGIVLGIYRRCGHLFKGLDAAQDHYFGLDRVIRNVSAVTGACLLVRADVFREAGGFDAECFPVDGNDVDLCLRIGAKGYRVLYTPYAELYHYESLSRGTVDRRTHPSEIQEFSRRWADIILDDPFYSPNLTRSGVDCSPRILGE